MSRKGIKEEGKGRRKDLVETESFPIVVDSAVVAVCNSSFTLSDSPEKKKRQRKGGREEGGREGGGVRTDGTTIRRRSNDRMKLPRSIQEQREEKKGKEGLAWREREGGDRSVCPRGGR